MHAIHSIGPTLDSSVARAILMNLADSQVITREAACLISAALSNQAYQAVAPSKRDALRASIFKNMLITLI